MGIQCAVWNLAWTTEAVEQAVEDGRLVAFDLRTSCSSKTSLRLLTASVRAAQRGAKFAYASQRRLAESIVPARAVLWQSEVAFLFHVATTHVNNLCLAGDLRAEAQRDPATHSRKFKRAEIVDFIACRLVQ
jgi:hypothetical protein